MIGHRTFFKLRDEGTQEYTIYTATVPVAGFKLAGTSSSSRWLTGFSNIVEWLEKRIRNHPPGQSYVCVYNFDKSKGKPEYLMQAGTQIKIDALPD